MCSKILLGESRVPPHYYTSFEFRKLLVKILIPIHNINFFPIRDWPLYPVHQEFSIQNVNISGLDTKYLWSKYNYKTFSNYYKIKHIGFKRGLNCLCLGKIASRFKI
jgi:hypothetical protein